MIFYVTPFIKNKKMFFAENNSFLFAKKQNNVPT
jgi:hypothetical protein